MAKKSGMDGRLAARDLHDVRLALVAHDRVEHLLHRREVAELRPVHAAVGVADRAGQVAGVGDLDQRQARVLLVVGAQAAVVRAAPLHRRVVALRHLRVLEEHLAAAPVVVDVVGHQHALGAVHRAVLQHQHAVVLEDDLRVDAAIARRADGDRGVVEQIRSGLGHGATSSAPPSIAQWRSQTAHRRRPPAPAPARTAAPSVNAIGRSAEASIVIAHPPQPPTASTAPASRHQRGLTEARPRLRHAAAPQPEHQQREGAGGERHAGDEQERPQVAGGARAADDAGEERGARAAGQAGRTRRTAAPPARSAGGRPAPPAAATAASWAVPAIRRTSLAAGRACRSWRGAPDARSSLREPPRRR